MGAYALFSQVTTLDGDNWSAFLKNSVLVLDAEELDTTDFASEGWKEFIGGLASGTLTLNFIDDLADNSVDEKLWSKFRTVVPFTVKGVDDTIGAGNPEYQGSVLITQYTLGGDVGALAGKSLTFRVSGKPVRDVAP